MAEDQPDSLAQGLPPAPVATSQVSEVRWTASEYVAHQKPTGWFLALGAVTLLLAVLVYFLTRDFISTAVIFVGATLFGMYAARPPRELEYALDKSGLQIGAKHFAYSNFRSFSVIPEGAFDSILFMPLKRFAVPLSIYFAPEDQEKILAVLSAQLPMETHKLDMIERFMRRIHF